jgi:hypothetical protein
MESRLRVRRGFKGLKQAIKLEFKLARYDKVHTATTNEEL